ncbi:acetyl-CoA C-acetyltransferase [Denitratisoma oestradiolicum]|uniref:Beta-ketoadipyl-CoA thiolase n=1 Tax=Denitratisoma oestradiolicum TaxID=311182 RepID=A0A6S6Y5U5_9PROT|nr:acetyl-CoA C-acetyltransferase [Denitratisoma oestradiolicum]TWO80771.1 acetyl-CoA acetyltransferase [Denitratisoma oestradiolicum]CAB1370917.1 Beta-ketoadipyl-CoA thiolase [Denitratisoma oestradiolicum]
MNGTPIYVVDGLRTPFLKARGGPGPFAAADLAVQAGRPLLLRQPFAPEDLSEVILGCAAPAPDEMNIGRILALRLGCGEKVPGWTVMRNCASGMQAIDSALADIQRGRAELVLAGGSDALSHAPLLFSEAMVRWLVDWKSARGLGPRLALLGRLRPAHLAPVLGLLKGLTDPVVGLSMGQTAENLAWEFGIGREAMDAYSVRSHQRALAAQALIARELAPLLDAAGSAYEADDGLRADANPERLAKLKPVFDRNYGTITAGNSSQVTDGAALVLLASAAAVERWKLQPLGRILDCQWAGLDPARMGLGPVHAATPILQRQGLGLNDVDAWEINEAFAAQVLACLAAWRSEDFCRTHLGLPGALGELDQERLNIHGGAIALGHPVGASGARIVLHLLHSLKPGGKGMAAICIGGGQGGAMLVERL